MKSCDLQEFRPSQSATDGRDHLARLTSSQDREQSVNNSLPNTKEQQVLTRATGTKNPRAQRITLIPWGSFESSVLGQCRPTDHPDSQLDEFRILIVDTAPRRAYNPTVLHVLSNPRVEQRSYAS
jgi:hypothetical protein